MDDSDGNIFDRFAAFLKDEADSSQNAVFTNESNMERDDGHLIRLVPMVDEKEKEAVHFGDLAHFAGALKDTSLQSNSSVQLISPHSSKLTPLFPITVNDELNVALEPPPKLAIVHSSRKKTTSKKRAMDLQTKVRQLWAGKIYLQHLCGFETTNNLRVSDVLKTAVTTIKKLEADLAERQREMRRLVSQQARLFDRVAAYKKKHH